MRHDEYDEQKVTEQVQAKLHETFPEVDAARVDAVAEDHVRAFAEAPVKDYVGTLAEHGARDELRGA